jgi:NAD(P)-dependent dehydrogenase (short-subunit alcohol dehydrogenase family)
MANKAVIVTGACGGIGSSLTHAFKDAGYFVVGTDLKEKTPQVYSDAFLQIDLQKIWVDSNYSEQIFSKLFELVGDMELNCFVNNAAVQFVLPIEEVTRAQVNEIFAVNVFAPFIFAQAFIEKLSESNGTIINVGSVHSTQTKPNFSIYAMTKSALDGITRSLAVECGSRVRVVGIAPGAISTTMLEDGFKHDQTARNELNKMQPMGRIGMPPEVADLAVFLASAKASFMNGSVVRCDGGISASLRDPG